MEGTRQNLARVKDILDEVRRQIGALRAAGPEGGAVQGVPGGTEGPRSRRVASRRRLAMTSACDAAREALGGIEDALLSARSDLTRMDAGREEARMTLAERDGCCPTCGTSMVGGRRRRARREAEWDGLRGQAEQLRRMVEEAEAEIASLEKEIAALDARIAEADGEAAVRVEELSRARDRWEMENASLAAAREEHRLAQEEVERAKSDLIVRVSQHSDARSGAEGLSQRIAEGSDRWPVWRTGPSRRPPRCKRLRATSTRRPPPKPPRGGPRGGGTILGGDGAALAAANARLDETVEAARSAESELRSAESRRATLAGLHERMDWASSGVRAVLRHFRGVEAEGRGDRGIFA